MKDTTTKQTVLAKSTRKTWIVALSNTESDTIFSQLVTGTKNQVKQYLVRLLKEERHGYKQEQDYDWDYGTTSAKNVQEHPGSEILDACGVWATFHITVSARPAQLTPTLHLGKSRNKEES